MDAETWNARYSGDELVRDAEPNRFAAAGPISFRHADVTSGPLPGGPFDAVIVACLPLEAPRRRAALRKPAGMLATGGTLLVAGQDSSNLTEGTGGPQDARVLFTRRT